MVDTVLGTTGISISKAILGCGTFGGIGGSKELIGKGLDRDTAYAVLDEALAAGINVLDTAERYADGESERTVGAWLKSLSPEVRARLHVCTKVAPPWADGPRGVPFDRKYIEHKMETSLERLGVDSVTFYMPHAADEDTPIEATLEGFAAVVESGRARHLGCSNYTAAQLREALEASERLGLPSFEWVQNGFNLLTPDGDREVRAICRERGMGYTPFSPMAGGVLTGKYKRGQPFPEGTRMALRPEGNEELLTEKVFDALDELGAEADRYKVTSASLCLAWIMNHPDCTAPVVGPRRTAPHLGHVGRAMELALSGGEHSRITGLFKFRDA